MIALPERKSKPESSPIHTRMAEIVAALMWGEKTNIELRDSVTVSKMTLARCMKALHASGVVYRRRKAQSIIWALQTKPFAVKDEA